MYLGKIVESGGAHTICHEADAPLHHGAVLAALPSHPTSGGEEVVLPGEVPSRSPASGCTSTRAAARHAALRQGDAYA